VVAVIAIVIGRAGDRRAFYRADTESNRCRVTSVAGLAGGCRRERDRTRQCRRGGAFEYRVHKDSFPCPFPSNPGPTYERGALFLATAIGRSRSSAKSFTIIWSRVLGAPVHVVVTKCDSLCPNTLPRQRGLHYRSAAVPCGITGKRPCRANRLRL